MKLKNIIENQFVPFSSPISRNSSSVDFSENIKKVALESRMPISQDEFEIQSYLRPLFGKPDLNKTKVGTPLSFIDIDNSNKKIKHYASTLFIDIKGSTRLSLLYDLEEIFLFKDQVLKTCIEIIRSFDGNVHRLMGDAVMAFFVYDKEQKEDSVADLINCCVTLRVVLENVIQPFLEKCGIDSKDFGFRIGCNFGNDEELLWGKFGFHNTGEFSVTGLPVDMASKLQALANKNETMLGQGIINFIDFPENYMNIKKTQNQGEKKEQPYVIPNLADKDGKPLNYTMRLLNYPSFLNLSALPIDLRESISDTKVKSNLLINYECLANGELYISASRFLEKEVPLVFRVTAKVTSGLNFPLTVHFIKTNHGSETPLVERDIEQTAIEKTLHTQRRSEYDRRPKTKITTEIRDATAYRGLHTMECRVFDRQGKKVFQNWIGVFIK